MHFHVFMAAIAVVEFLLCVDTDARKNSRIIFIFFLLFINELFIIPT